MITVDALGKPCPVPVVHARQAVARLPREGGTVRVLVDNRVACENLGKMAAGSGYSYQIEEQPDGTYAVTITVGAGVAEQAPASASAPTVSGEAGLVVAIGRDTMGHGSDELGKILIKGFIYSLSQLETPPKAVAFFNGGVYLAAEGASTLDDLAALSKGGCRIMVCGTCADYYGIKEQVAVGEIVNMYDIVETLAEAGKVVNLS